VYTGKGSLYQVYIGTGYRIKDFSIGFNAGYVFGKLDYTKGFAFTDSIGEYNIQNATSVKVSGFIYNVGIQYKKRGLRKKHPKYTLRQTYLSLPVHRAASNIKMTSRTSSQWERDISIWLMYLRSIDSPLTYSEQKKAKSPYHIASPSASLQATRTGG
jgi:hypothetical protein